VDVPGDGNCFFHAVVASQATRVPNAAHLRTELVERIMAMKDNEMWEPVLNVVYAHYSKVEGFYSYVHGLLESGKWATDLEMVFMFLAFGIDIVSITNTPGGFNVFRPSAFISMMRLDLPADFVQLDTSIYLYHHAYKKPLSPSVPNNHFCVLFEVTNEDTKALLFEGAYKGAKARPSFLATSKESELVPVKREAVTKNDKKRKGASDETGASQKLQKAAGKPASARTLAIEASKEKKQNTLLAWLPDQSCCCK
jgi:hypothetical protein